MKLFNRGIRLHDLATLIDEALEFEPPLLLKEFCAAYYSPYYLFMNQMANRLDEKGLLVELGCDMARGLVSLALSGKPVVGIDHTRPIVHRLQPERPGFGDRVLEEWDKLLANYLILTLTTPTASLLSNSVVPVSRSRIKISLLLLPSTGTRLLALDAKTT